MKKILFILSAFGLALCLATSCEDKEEEQEVVSTMRGVFTTAVIDAASTFEMLPGKTKSVSAQVCTVDGAVSDITLKLSLKVDPEGVAVYNSANGKNAVMLPQINSTLRLVISLLRMFSSLVSHRKFSGRLFCLFVSI